MSGVASPASPGSRLGPRRATAWGARTDVLVAREAADLAGLELARRVRALRVVATQARTGRRMSAEIEQTIAAYREASARACLAQSRLRRLRVAHRRSPGTDEELAGGAGGRGPGGRGRVQWQGAMPTPERR
jgi:hypothetical protein